MTGIKNNPFYESALILMEDGDMKSLSGIITYLEDTLSPVNQRLQRNLYQSMIDKDHIDFGDIPNSRGNIRNYSGYDHMMETLNVMEELAKNEKNRNVIEYVEIVKTTIKYIETLTSTFEKAFQVNCPFVIKEYQIMVYMCVEATTSLIYQYVDYIKRPNLDMFDIKLRNTKMRGDAFYFDMLTKFNKTMDNMQIEYREMLEEMMSQKKSNLIGTDDIIGIATVSAVAYFIIPFTRRLIYHFENMKGKLSESLAAQAYFLEMNKASVESNSAFDAKKKKEILDKQDRMRKLLISLSDKLRVKYTKAISTTKKDLDRDNKRLSIDGLKKEVSDSDFSLI